MENRKLKEYYRWCNVSILNFLFSIFILHRLSTSLYFFYLFLEI